MLLGWVVLGCWIGDLWGMSLGGEGRKERRYREEEQEEQEAWILGKRLMVLVVEVTG